MTIYFVRTLGDEREPEVPYDHPQNQEIDWPLVGDLLEGNIPTDDTYLANLDIYVPADHPFDALRIDSRILLSERLAAALEPHCKPDADFLPLLVNGRRFYALLVVTMLNVLDLSRSDVTYFRSNPSKVKSIRKYAFVEGADTLAKVFRLPEDPGRTFAVDSVRDAYLASGIPGLRFVDAVAPPPGEPVG